MPDEIYIVKIKSDGRDITNISTKLNNYNLDWTVLNYSAEEYPCTNTVHVFGERCASFLYLKLSGDYTEIVRCVTDLSATDLEMKAITNE